MEIDKKLLDKAKYKFSLIKEFIRSNKSVSEFCKEKSIKKRTFYRWRAAFNKRSFDGLIEKSKRPKTIIETPKWVQDIVLELNKIVNLGCKNISQTLGPIYSLSHSGVLKILRRKGIKIVKEKKRWKSFRAPYKNYMWQVDFLGPYSTPIDEISILVVLDDYSRFVMSKIVSRNGTTKDVIDFLDECIAKHKKPEKILTNHGTQFRKIFKKWCRKRDVKHIQARVRHPQTLGKVEAVNKMLGRCFVFDFESILKGRRKLECIVMWYNHVHYHSVIGCTPAEAYEIQKDRLAVLEEMAKILKLPKMMAGIRMVKRN